MPEVSAAKWQPFAGTLCVNQRRSGDTCWWARSRLAALEREGATLAEADKHNVRTKMIDILAHAIDAVVLSRACPDDSALADQILEVCRVEPLAPLLPSLTN